MVLGCSVCNQPLVIRPTKVGCQDPSYLMKKLRAPRPKASNINDNTNSKGNVDLNDAEIVATRCGHMFHKDCLKHYLQGVSLTKINVKPRGCPMCHKPVIQSQLWPIIIRATRDELKQIEKIKSLKYRNTELVNAIKEIRQNTQEKNSALQEARKNMFDCRVKLQGMDEQTCCKGDLEKLEKQQANLEKELADVNEQNLALTSLVERESVYAQKIRSLQNSTNVVSNRNSDSFEKAMKKLAFSRVRNEAFEEKSSPNSVLEALRKIENPPSPVIVPDALERWRQMKSSILLQNGQGNIDGRQFFQIKAQDLSFDLYKDDTRNPIQKNLKPEPHGQQRPKGPSKSRNKTPSVPSPRPIVDKIATVGLGSDFLKLENKVRNKWKNT